jgi:hypothetical protein
MGTMDKVKCPVIWSALVFVLMPTVGGYIPKNPRRLETVCQISVAITSCAPFHFHGPSNLNLVLTLALKAQQIRIFQPRAATEVKDGADPMSVAS